MKLYNVVGSGNCRKVLATATNLGLPIEIEHMDFVAGDLSRPDFIAVNPNGRVPTLVDDGYCLWESNAIMQYLADQGADNPLFPKNARKRADIVRWQCWELAHFNNAFGTIAFETVLKPNFMQQKPNIPVVDYASQNLTEFAKILDQHLENRKYVISDTLTLADYSIINMEGFKEMIPFDWSPFPHLNDYFDRMRSDPHWASTAPESPEAIGRKPAVA